MTFCTTCAALLPASYAVLRPAQTRCVLCRVLAPYQPGGTHYAPRLALQQRKVLAQEKLSSAPESVSPDSDAIEARIVAWAVAHNNRWPNVRDIGQKNNLPPLSAIVKRWGGLIPMRAALHARYPELQGRYVLAWTPSSIYAAVADWMVRHPGAMPMSSDFQHDETLPVDSVVYRLFRGLKQFYRVFEAGKYAEQFEQSVLAQRRNASAKGHLVQKAQRGDAVNHEKSARPSLRWLSHCGNDTRCASRAGDTRRERRMRWMRPWKSTYGSVRRSTRERMR